MPNLPLPFVITKLCSFPWYLVRPHALGKTIHWASWFHPMPFLDLQKLNMPAGWDADSCNMLNNIYWSTLDSLLICTGEAQVEKNHFNRNSHCNCMNSWTLGLRDLDQVWMYLEQRVDLCFHFVESFSLRQTCSGKLLVYFWSQVLFWRDLQSQKLVGKCHCHVWWNHAFNKNSSKGHSSRPASSCKSYGKGQHQPTCR